MTTNEPLEPDSGQGHCRPFVHETRRYKSLHFSLQQTQSRMSKLSPDALVADYTRTMMGFVLFDQRPDRIAIIGLGGGSLAKFCFRALPHSRIDVVEVNPHVAALRDEFHVPPDSERFHVHVDDGARFVGQRPKAFDVLLVDAYTRMGIPTKLASQAFYLDCRRALRNNGIMVLNLYREDAQTHIERIRRSFGGLVFAVDEESGINRIVFACAGKIEQTPDAQLRAKPWFAFRPTFSRVLAALPTQHPEKGAE